MLETLLNGFTLLKLNLNKIILFRYKNLTNKYYAVKLLRHILHLHLSVQWKAHLEEPPGEQKLEKGIQVYQDLFCTRNIMYF